MGCMAHARRKFSEAVKAQGRNKKRGKAHRGLTLIQKLYRVEKQARKSTPEARYNHRLQHARPILDEMRAWLDEALPQVPPTSATGKALNYLHNEWPKLIVYLRDGRLEIDNNGAENAIRPFVIGRKNWLFSASVKDVKASANLYSLIETARSLSDLGLIDCAGGKAVHFPSIFRCVGLLCASKSRKTGLAFPPCSRRSPKPDRLLGRTVWNPMPVSGICSQNCRRRKRLRPSSCCCRVISKRIRSGSVKQVRCLLTAYSEKRQRLVKSGRVSRSSFPPASVGMHTGVYFDVGLHAHASGQEARK